MLNRAHVQLGITLERERVLYDDGVIEDVIDDRDDLRTVARSAENDLKTPTEREPNVDTELQRVIDHERDGNLASPFEDAEGRQSYREAVERELDDAQQDRLRAGDADVLKDQIEDRLDRLYIAFILLAMIT